MSRENNKLPRLRFPEFRDAGDWEEKRLGEVASFSKGKGISKADIDENGTLECIRYGQLYTDYSETIKDVKSRTNVLAKKLVLSDANDIIIPASGETQIDIATASCVLKSGVALGGDLNIVKTKHNGVFLSYYLNGKLKYDIARLSQGISVIHLYAAQLKLLYLNFPTLPEQQKIADCLSSLDDLITAQTQKLAQLKTHKKGLMQQLFPAEGETVPKLRFPEFRNAGDWEEKEGNLVFEQISNKKHDSNLPVLAITQEYGAIPRVLIDFHVSVTDKSIKNYKVVEEGDFIISLRTFQGGIEHSKYKGICSPAYVILRKSQSNSRISISGGFFKYYFKTGKFIRDLSKNIEGLRDGKMVSYKQFSALMLPIPLVEEQQKIAACLSSLDELITAQTQKLAQLKTHKKGLMQQLFPAADEVNK